MCGVTDTWPRPRHGTTVGQSNASRLSRAGYETPAPSGCDHRSRPWISSFHDLIAVPSQRHRGNGRRHLTVTGDVRRAAWRVWHPDGFGTRLPPQQHHSRGQSPLLRTSGWVL